MLYQNYGNQFAAIRELFPENTGTVYALSYLANRGDERSAGTLSVSSDMGVLLRRMLNDLEARNTRVVLSHVMKVDNGFSFTHEAEATGVEDLYLHYSIVRVDTLPLQKGGTAA